MLLLTETLCGMVWYDMICYEMLWYDMIYILYDMIWHIYDMQYEAGSHNHSTNDIQI